MSCNIEDELEVEHNTKNEEDSSSSPSNNNAITQNNNNKHNSHTIFPTLSIDVFLNNDNNDTNNKLKGYANSSKGIPIDTDIFIGTMLILIRPNTPPINEDHPNYYTNFFKNRKRRFEIQFQGKLKRLPKGIVYGGAELAHEMKLGLVAKGISNLLLRLLSKIIIDMHYSFGDEKNTEYAHIVFPLWSFVDKLVITKNGEPPPL